MGDSDQFGSLPPADTRQADRILLSGLLTWRITGLATAVAAVATAGGRFRSCRLAVAQLVGGIAESVWFARRVTRSARWSDPVAAAVDATTAATLLTAGRFNLPRPDRVTWINWTPWSFAASAVCGQAMVGRPLVWRLAGAAPVVAAHLADGPTVGDALANGVAHAAFFTAARFFALEIRSSAVRLDRARNAAIEQGRALARAQERARQLRDLHDGAVQVLESIAAGRQLDLRSMHERAREEADRLAREVDRPAEGDVAFATLLAGLAQRFAAQGLPVDLDAPSVPPLPGDVALALSAACAEALTNVSKHAGNARAWVRARSRGDGVEVQVRDRGRGFDPDAIRGGFGIANSIRARVSEVGGTAEVISRPGGGTSVVLRWPS